MTERDGRENLVLALGVHPFLPPEVAAYVFPSDVAFRFSIDVAPAIRIDRSPETAAFGGIVRAPSRIREDLRFEISFDDEGQARLDVQGVPRRKRRAILARTRMFAGLRSDAFVFAPFHDRNIAAIVLEIPLSLIGRGHPVLLTWATTDVDDPDFTAVSPAFQELGGRALRSQNPEFEAFLNAAAPSRHAQLIRAAARVDPALAEAPGFSALPDVLILDTSRPSGFPNGRLMSDDVVAQIAALPEPYADPRIRDAEIAVCAGEEHPPRFPADVPTRPCDAFIDADFARFPGGAPSGASDTVFPYLGEPHR